VNANKEEILLPVDHHVHTPLCGHAEGAPRAYVNAADGLAGVGFSDHLPYLEPDVVDPTLAMSWDELPVYLDQIQRLKAKSPTPVLLGVEADYFPGQEAKLEKILAALPLDYVYGGIHWVGDWPFDDARHLARYDGADVAALYRGYYGLVADMARAGLFDIWAHPDLPKKFGYRPIRSVRSAEDGALAAIAEAGMVLEINTSGLRKPVKEIYPTLDLLRRACALGIDITFGSDAHAPHEVGHEFEKAVALAADAGYRGYVTFSKRQRIAARLR
jgi:histidinol-phosphatase (PHP family)